MRKKLYNKIKELGLQAKVVEAYGVNYTNVPNSELVRIIEIYTTPEEEDIPNDVNTKKFNRLVEVLLKKRILLKSEFDYIME